MSDCGNVQKVFAPTDPEKVQQELATREPIKGIEITDKASEKILIFVKGEQKSASEYGLFISVKKDGCSGLSYEMKISPIAESQARQDKIFEKNGAFAMIEKSSYFYVTGSYLDYIEALTGSGFTLVNPNINKTCSCGSSFSVKDATKKANEEAASIQ